MSWFGGDSGFGLGDALGIAGAIAGLYGLYDASKGGGSGSGSQTVKMEPAPRDADGQTIWNAYMESLMGTGEWNKMQAERAAAMPGASIIGNLAGGSIGGTGGGSRGTTMGAGGSGDIGGYEAALGDGRVSLSDLGGMRDYLGPAASFGIGTLAAMASPFAAGISNMQKDATIRNIAASLNDVVAGMNYSSSPYGIDPKTGLAVNIGGSGGSRDGGMGRAKDLDRSAGGLGAASGYGGPGRGDSGGSWA